MAAKVLFIISSLNRGGTELRLLDVIRGLNRERLHPVLFVAKGGGELLAETDGLSVIVGASAGSSVLAGLFALWRCIRQEKPQAVWCVQNGLVSAAGQLFAWLSGYRVIILSLHGRYERRRTIDQLNRLFARWITRKIVVVSDQLRRWLVEEGIPDENIAVSYNGVDTTRFVPPTNRATFRHSLLSIEEPCFVVGTIGNLLPIKAQDVLLKAAAIVVDNVPNTLFVIVGEGPERRSLEKLCNDLGLENKVRMLGRRTDDLPSILQTLDVFVLTSNNEGLPNVVLEAMAAGLPTVCTRVGGTPEVITPETGLLIAPQDPQALASALLHLFSDSDMRQRMGLAARQRAIQHFSSTEMIRRREQLLLELLKESNEERH